MRLSLVISSLGRGGAERVLTTMANWWAGQGHEVRVVLLGENARPDYPLDRRITVTALNLAGQSRGVLDGVVNNVRRIRALRSRLTADHPDVVVGFMDTTNVLTALAAIGVARVVLTEHMPPMLGLSFLWRVLRAITYFFADTVVVQTPEAQAYHPALLRRRIEVLPNPVEFPAASAESKGKVLVSMGRLAPEKRFDVLIRVFARLGQRFPEWTMTLLGEGEERVRLERLCESLGVADRVSLPGWVADPERVLATGGVYVMASRFEGFCNALVEGMSMALPAVAFDCPGGPKTIIRDGVDGRLVADGDEDALARAVEELMADGELRRAMGEKGAEVRNRFGIEASMARWDGVLGLAKNGRAA